MASRVVHPFRRGLLASAGDLFYAKRLDFNDARALHQSRGLLWQAAGPGRDAPDKTSEYLRRISQQVCWCQATSRLLAPTPLPQVDDFLHEHQFYGREPLTEAVRRVVDRPRGGEFALLLGGKNVGKSQLLPRLVEAQPSIALASCSMMVRSLADLVFQSLPLHLKRRVAGRLCEAIDPGTGQLRTLAEALLYMQLCTWLGGMHVTPRVSLASLLAAYVDSDPACPSLILD
jgi:hypothetical protein